MARAVLLDFYGTLARDVHPTSTIDEVLGRRGYRLSDDLRERSWHGDLDGIEHLDQSRSRDHYTAWERDRMLGMLAEADVHPGEYELILAEIHAGRAHRALRAYPEVPEALGAMRARGLALAVCSNWDWDLEAALAEAGLAHQVDVLVSSAWAGARKPHPRIFRHTLDLVSLDAGQRDAGGLDPGDVLFVGDTWGPDVEGPRAAGMCALYLEREGHWPDPTMPADPAPDVARVGDLTGVVQLL